MCVWRACNFPIPHYGHIGKYLKLVEIMLCFICSLFETLESNASQYNYNFNINNCHSSSTICLRVSTHVGIKPL